MSSKLQQLITAVINVASFALRSIWQSKTLPLRGLIIVPFIVQIFATVSVVSYWSFDNGQRSVNALIVKLENQASERVEQHLNSYLSCARQLTELNAKAINSGLLKSSELHSLGRFFWTQVKLYNVSNILFGFKTGELLAVGHLQSDKFSLYTAFINRQQYGDSKLRVYKSNQQENQGKLLSTFENYPFEKEGWYAETIQKGKPGWTSVYNMQLLVPDPVSISFGSPIYDKNRNLIGAIAVEQQLSQISNFLRQVEITPSTTTFIIERNGLMIASSSSTPPYTFINNKFTRINAKESDNSIIQTTAKYLTKQFANFGNIQQQQQLDFEIQGQRHFVLVNPWQDKLGLNWIMVIVIPEADFMGQININTRNTILLCAVALIVAMIIGILTAQKITQPILYLNASAKAIAAGNLDHTVNVQGINELEVLSQSFNQMAAQLQQSFTALENANYELEQRVEERTSELEKANQELQRISRVDELTQIANRRCFDEYLSQQWNRLKSEQQPLSLILGDIDYFKKYNDFYGHQHGDWCLQQIASSLQQVVKSPADLVARYGGEEFAVILPLKDTEAALIVAQAIRQEIHQAKLPHACSEINDFITMSLGIASVVPTSAVSPEHLIAAADKALYQAKQHSSRSMLYLKANNAVQPTE